MQEEDLTAAHISTSSSIERKYSRGKAIRLLSKKLSRLASICVNIFVANSNLL
jgi:hypothetical protein